MGTITTTSISNTPQAGDDYYGAGEDFAGILTLDVMANDLGGKDALLDR
jgi:hypothetical protein